MPFTQSEKSAEMLQMLFEGQGMGKTKKYTGLISMGVSCFPGAFADTLIVNGNCYIVNCCCSVTVVV